MIIWPGLRRSVSAIQRLFNSASVSLPLTHTAIPTRGSVTPAFTRATTETGQKWDEAGYLDFTALAGEIVFKGARREYNQWTTSSVSLASGANKSLTLTAGTYQFSMGAGTGTATFSGTGGATGTLGASASGRVSVAKTITAGTFVVTASVADLADLQVCNITGETDQTTIRPYVSVGVESAPAYHGSMVDGVKCYDTDRSGNPISTSGSYPLVGYVPWEAETNLIIQSQTLGTSWVLTNGGQVTVESDVLVAPNGTTTADKIHPTITNGSHSITSAAFTITAGDTVTVTAYLKQGSYAVDQVYLTNVAISKYAGMNFTYATGLLSAAASVSYSVVSSSVETRPNGWFRVCIEFLTNTDTSVQVQHYLNGGAVYVGTVTDYSSSWGWMATKSASAGRKASPYIPTTTAAVARNADILTYTGADVANIKTLAATFSRGVGVTASGYIVALSDNTLNEFAASYLNTATQQRFNGYDGGVNQWEIISSNAYTPGATSKASWSMATNDVKADLDGTAQTADTSATLPAVTQLQVGHLVGLYQLNGPVNHIYGWTRNLSQSELGAVDA